VSTEPGPIPRDASVGYCLLVPLPFVLAPAVLALRGVTIGLALAIGFLIAFGGMLIGSIPAMILLQASAVVRRRLEATVFPLFGTIAALIIALRVPVP